MKTIIGIMGPSSDVTSNDLKNAYEIGKYCALKGYITLTGGQNRGIMNEGLKGAKENGGLTVGILPNDDKSTFSKYLDIPICTNMLSGRNYINVLSSDVIIACGISYGTSSEISLALKPKKPIILVGIYEEANIFYKKLAPNQVHLAKDYKECCQILDNLLQ